VSFFLLNLLNLLNKFNKINRKNDTLNRPASESYLQSTLATATYLKILFSESPYSGVSEISNQNFLHALLG
jgi:hypothetical protein